MLTIWRAQVLTFIIIYIHSFDFVALAAPVPTTSQTHFSLRKRESPDGNRIHPDVHSRESKLLGRPAPQNVLLSDGPRPTQLALNEHAARSISRRGFFSSIGRAIKRTARKFGNAVRRVGNGINRAVRKVGNGVRQAVRKVGSGIRRVAQRVSNGVRQSVRKFGNGIKRAARKIGNGIRRAANSIKRVAQKVGNAVVRPIMKAATWVKDNGAAFAKAAKVALKVTSTVTSIAGRVANFIPIPGAGKILSKGLKYASAGMDKGSSAIPGDLGGFGKAMDVMDKIQHPIGGVGGQILDTVLKRREVGLSL